MNCIRFILLCGLTSTALCLSAAGRRDEAPSRVADRPPLETFILQPVSVDSISVWVPADKSGPIINRSCTARRNGIQSSTLSARVRHTKTDHCPDGLARLLAEYAALRHERNLPLTIFNGWQWEGSCSLCQFASTLYDLKARGGSWENAREAVLTRTLGSVAGEWILVPCAEDPPAQPRASEAQSHIEVTTFDSLRTRDGYPKARQFP